MPMLHLMNYSCSKYFSSTSYVLQIVGTMVNKNSYNPCYHGTDAVAEETAITDVCDCACVCVCVCEIPRVGKSRVLGSTGQLQPTTQVT